MLKMFDPVNSEKVKQASNHLQFGSEKKMRVRREKDAKREREETDKEDH